ncbi:unnamed protein product [Prunus armeniaca]|uniref:Uncharacterized protein n=1 Tax=Prunus armeniaca TaxID=36596 RepID=A0A6J5VR75_PRUAR|nr:unnamed protein product [Prunus armeniaca]
MKESSNESDSDDTFEYTSSSDEETNHIALAVSTPNFTSDLVHRANEGKSKSEVESDSSDDDLSSDLDEITYRELCEKYDGLFNETCKIKERNIFPEVKVHELEELNVTLRETKKELSDNIDSLESELNALEHLQPMCQTCHIDI